MPNVFDYAIAYVEELSAFPAAVAREAGVKGLAIKLQDTWGNPACDRNYAALKNGKSAELRAQGFSLGVWSCPREHPVPAADDVSALYVDLGLSFAVFETEIQYRTVVDVADLLTEWRKYRPNAYTGFAVETATEDFDNAALIADPRTFLCPENYWRLGEQYDVRPTLIRAAQLGWPINRVKSTLTGVEGHSLAEACIRLYRAIDGWHEDYPAGLPGFLLWRGDMLTDAQYALLGKADTLALR